MSRYYFHLVNGERQVQDPVGIDLSEAEVFSVISPTLKAAIEAEEPELLVPWRGWRLQVTDADGWVVTALIL